MKTRTVCIQHPDAAAKYPPERPMFCGLHCAALAGIALYEDHIYCVQHRTWNDGPCWACEKKAKP